MQQAPVQAPDQAQVQGMRGDTLDAVHQRREHVAHLVEPVEAGAGGRRGDLVEQNLREAHVGALHARRTEGFLAEERRHHGHRARHRQRARERTQSGVGA